MQAVVAQLLKELQGRPRIFAGPEAWFSGCPIQHTADQHQSDLARGRRRDMAGSFDFPGAMPAGRLAPAARGSASGRGLNAAACLLYPAINSMATGNGVVKRGIPGSVDSPGFRFQLDLASGTARVPRWQGSDDTLAARLGRPRSIAGQCKGDLVSRYFKYKSSQSIARRRPQTWGWTSSWRRSDPSLRLRCAVGGRTVGNRLAIQPMEGCDGNPDGTPGELTLRRYRRFGAGGAKLIWGEACAVVPEGRANPRQLLINERHGGRPSSSSSRPAARPTSNPAAAIMTS